MIRKHFRWGKTHAEMETSIKALLGTCLQCLKTAAGEVVTRPLGSSLVAERPGEITSFDWMKVGDASVLVLMDKFSGLVALCSMVAATVIFFDEALPMAASGWSLCCCLDCDS